RLVAGPSKTLFCSCMVLFLRWQSLSPENPNCTNELRAMRCFYSDRTVFFGLSMAASFHGPQPQVRSAQSVCSTYSGASNTDIGSTLLRAPGNTQTGQITTQGLSRSTWPHALLSSTRGL